MTYRLGQTVYDRTRPEIRGLLVTLYTAHARAMSLVRVGKRLRIVRVENLRESRPRRTGYAN